MKKIFLAFACLIVTSMFVNAQDIAEFYVSNSEIASNSKEASNNSVDISFKLNNIEHIDNVIVEIKSLITNESISETIIVITNSDGVQQFSYGNYKRTIKRGYIVFPSNIGKFTVKDIVIEAHAKYKNGKASKKTTAFKQE